MKKSRYTVLYDVEGGCLVYNTYNGIQAFIASSETALMDDLNKLRTDRVAEIADRNIRRAFCVEDGVDEAAEVMAKYYSENFDPTNLSLIIMPNNMCNFECVYCFQEHDRKHISNEMVGNLIAAVKDYHAQHGLRRFYIEWFGGEPMISYPVIRCVTEELSVFFEENGIDYHYGMTTNGSLLSPEKVDYLLAHRFDFFQITVDGGPKTHNYYRPYAGGLPSWDDITDNLLYMKSRPDDFEVSVRVNFNEEIYEDIETLVDFIAERLDERFTLFFHGIGKWGGKNDDNFSALDDNLEAFTRVLLIRDSVKHKICPKLNFEFFDPMHRVCYAGKPYHFTVGSDGKLRKCSEESEEGDAINVVGTIENGRFEYDRAKWSAFVLPGGGAALRQQCVECVHLPVCYGQSCPKNRVKNGGEYSCPADLSLMSEMLYEKYRFMSALYESRKAARSADNGGETDEAAIMRDIEEQTMQDINEQTMKDIEEQTMRDIEEQTMKDIEEQTMKDINEQAMRDIERDMEKQAREAIR